IAVAVEVRDRQADRATAHRIRDLRLERPIALAQQNAHRPIAAVGYREVGESISVEVPCLYSLRLRPYGIRHLRLERTISVAQQDTDGVVIQIADRQIHIAV